MKLKVSLIDDSARNRIIDKIRNIPLNPLHEVVVRPKEIKRSIVQNSLYWMWITIIANELGETKEAIHIRYKRKILIHIFERDDPEYAEMIEAVRTVHKSGMKVEAIKLSNQIVKLTSTTQTDVKQFTEYLNDIEKDAMGIQIALPHPEDRYNIAMGVRKRA
uniref:Putative lambda recombination protein n=1 Tax=viral metagenome TaxID=1070528 RepID=A0A6M3JJE1_9ZZZZ